jgi:predicted small secreted protein
MKTTPQRLLLLILISVLGAFAGTSCGTFRGFGRDVGHVGHHIERAAR